VKLSMGGLGTKQDLDSALAFFKNRDNSMYAMPLEQSLDGIRANINWLEVKSLHEVTVNTSDL
jgi:hypothetical protein